MILNFWPLYQRIQKVVDFLLYGGRPDIKKQMREFGQELYRATDIASMVESLQKAVETALQLTNSCAVLVDNGKTEPPPAAGPVLTAGCGPCHGAAWRLDKDGALCAYFERRSEPIAAHHLRQQLGEQQLPPAEAQLLGCKEVRWWVPLLGREQVLGVLGLGPRRGGGDLSAWNRSRARSKSTPRPAGGQSSSRVSPGGRHRIPFSWEEPMDPIQVIIADDHPVTCLGVEEALKREADMQVVGAVMDSAQVLPLVKEKRPDVLILDIEGMQALEVLKALPELPHVPRVLVLSTHCEPLNHIYRKADANSRVELLLWALDNGLAGDRYVIFKP